MARKREATLCKRTSRVPGATGVMSETRGLVEKQGPRVPNWFYLDPPMCGLHKAAFIWWSNVVCAIFHLGLAAATVVAATQGGKGMDTPRLTIYVTDLTWVSNSTNMLTPKNKAVDGLYLAHMTMWFFLLSFLAHFTIVIGNWRQVWALKVDEEKNEQYVDPEKSKVSWYSGWYYVWIHECRQPLRHAPPI